MEAGKVEIGNDETPISNQTNGVPEISEERRDEIVQEIKKLEEDINLLKQSLQRKEKKLNELRVEIGETRWARIQNSQAMNKSKQALSEAGQKTTQVLRSISAATASKWTEIKESPRMATVSERFWSTTGAVKAKIVGETPTQGAVEASTAQLVQPENESNA